jgi:ATP-dependent RNA helicase RhlB
MGFIPDVRRIVSKLPEAGERQTMFFSATLTNEITRLVERWLVNPVSIEAESENIVTDLIEQKFYTVSRDEKLAMLLWLIGNSAIERMLVFGNRKDTTAILVNKLRKFGVRCEILSGDVPQKKRLKILDLFRKGDIKVLIATDVAARGIHVDGVSHVINYDLPEKPEDYIHRIGRTGRAGAAGISISFVCEYGAYCLGDIEKLLGYEVNCIYPDEQMVAMPEYKRKSKESFSL